MEIGSYIKEKRKANSLTLRELADALGLSHSYLSQIENGRRKATPSLLQKISQVLGISYIELLRIGKYDEILEIIDGPSINVFTDFADRSQIERLASRSKILESALDIKNLLELKNTAFETENIQPYYNGHLLTDQDRQRILDMLKTLFPEYNQEK